MSSQRRPSAHENLESSKVPCYEGVHTNDAPLGVFPLLWSKVETVFLYAWVLLQTLLLLAGLTVLHFSTFSIMVCYLVQGTFLRRRELKPQWVKED